MVKNLISKNIGLKAFHAGVLFLAAAPSISIVLLIFSSIFGSLQREENYFKDRYNLPFIFASILMIINSIFLSFNILQNQYLDISLTWIGLLNWLPFFWLFWSFQKFLDTQYLRLQCAKFLILSSIPVLISGFSQFFLKLYGPYKIFFNSIIWYQRPLLENHGVTGMFNNQNYYGAWLCIILPLCLGFLLKESKNIKLKIFYFFNVISFVYMTILTTSRGSILSIILSLSLIINFKKLKIIRFLIIFIFIAILLTLLINSEFNFKENIINLMPSGLISKINLFEISEIKSFHRIEIWSASIKFIKSNTFLGYGAGSFSEIYKAFYGDTGQYQHTHNILLEIAFNYGLPSALLIVLNMIYMLINAFLKNINFKNFSSPFSFINETWIISFSSFLFIHIFDITYFDGRISMLGWILLSGLCAFLKEDKKEYKLFS